GFFRDVVFFADRRVHFHSRAEPMVEPNRAVGAGYLVAEVHAATEGPANFELADGAIFVAHESDRVVLGFDRMDERISPAHNLDWPDVLANEVAGDFDTVAAEVDDGSAAGKLFVPEPIAMWARMRFS